MIADRFRDDGDRGNAMGIVSIALGLGPIGKNTSKIGKLISFIVKYLINIFNFQLCVLCFGHFL